MSPLSSSPSLVVSSFLAVFFHLLREYVQQFQLPALLVNGKHSHDIFTFFSFGEIRNLTTFTRLMDYNNSYLNSSFFLSLLCLFWIGAQFPQEKFLSYGRILTLDFYFLLMCILFLFLWKKKTS